MLLDLQVFGDTSGGYTEPVNKMFDDFVDWKRRMKLPCSQKRFSVKTLVRETTYGWYLNAKGFSARVISEWLMDKVIETTADPRFHDLEPRLDLCETALTLACIAG